MIRSPAAGLLGEHAHQRGWRSEWEAGEPSCLQPGGSKPRVPNGEYRPVPGDKQCLNVETRSSDSIYRYRYVIKLVFAEAMRDAAQPGMT